MPVLGGATPLVVEGALTIIAIAVPLAIGWGIRSDFGPWRGMAHLLGVAIVIDVVLYLTSIPVALVLWGGFPNLVEQRTWLVPVLLVNVVLLLMGVTITRRARRP